MLVFIINTINKHQRNNWKPRLEVLIISVFIISEIVFFTNDNQYKKHTSAPELVFMVPNSAYANAPERSWAMNKGVLRKFGEEKWFKGGEK